MSMVTTAGILVTFVVPTQTAIVGGIPREMEGGGRACYGHFLHTGSRLDWKATFTSCQSAFTVIEHKDLHWLLKVKKSRTCAYSVIEVQGAVPSSANQGMWNITGYEKVSDVGKLGAEALGCGMIPIGRKPERLTTSSDNRETHAP